VACAHFERGHCAPKLGRFRVARATMQRDATLSLSSHDLEAAQSLLSLKLFVEAIPRRRQRHAAALQCNRPAELAQSLIVTPSLRRATSLQFLPQRAGGSILCRTRKASFSSSLRRVMPLPPPHRHSHHLPLRRASGPPDGKFRPTRHASCTLSHSVIWHRGTSFDLDNFYSKSQISETDSMSVILETSSSW
jgi:hypothetical protein